HKPVGELYHGERPELSRTALEALREPLEAGVARISRVNEQVEFPAEFQLIAAMNPCPCGHRGDGTDRCRCSPSRLEQYRSRISGPLLDRFDLHVEVPRAPFEEPSATAPRRETAELRDLVVAARARQLARAGKLNARLSDAELWRSVRAEREALTLLRLTASRWQLSMRSSVRAMKVARTIA